MADENEMRKICRNHGWDENQFLAEIKRLVKSYAYTPEGALAQAQKHYARKFGVNSKESRLRKIARNQGFDEGVFLKEYGRLIAEGRSDMDALSQTMKLFEKGAKIEGKPTLADFGPERLEELERAEDAKLGAPPGEIPRPPKEKPIQPPKVEVKPKTKTAYDKLMELADGGDYLEFFGSAGHGKSRFLAHVAIEAKRSGKKVLFLDCEHSISDRIKKELGGSYKRLSFMDLDRIIDEIARIRDGYDLICYDSVGFPVFMRFVQMKLHERGDAIAKTVLIRGYLKDYAERNRVLAIAANQPVSELYGMTHELGDLEHRPPVGGKSIHAAKGVIRMTIEKQIPEGKTIFGLRAFDCQDLPFNKLLATFTISGEGEKVEWNV